MASKRAGSGKGSGQPDLSPAASLDRVDRLLEHWAVRGTGPEASAGRPGVTEDRAVTI